jgi:hypothetical protein
VGLPKSYAAFIVLPSHIVVLLKEISIMQSFYVAQKLDLDQRPDLSQKSDLVQQSSDVASMNSVAKANQVDYWLGSLIILMPLALTIAFLAHRRHRSASLQRQVALLEKLWKVNTHERSS